MGFLTRCVHVYHDPVAVRGLYLFPVLLLPWPMVAVRNTETTQKLCLVFLGVGSLKYGSAWRLSQRERGQQPSGPPPPSKPAEVRLDLRSCARVCTLTRPPSRKDLGLSWAAPGRLPLSASALSHHFCKAPLATEGEELGPGPSLGS